ncbi:MAG: hypothetical protein ACRCUX_01095 [Beijerinckiaceae bacterium]
MNKALFIAAAAAALALTPVAFSFAGTAPVRAPQAKPAADMATSASPARSTAKADAALETPAPTAQARACNSTVRVVYAGHGEPPCTAPASLADLKASVR